MKKITTLFGLLLILGLASCGSTKEEVPISQYTKTQVATNNNSNTTNTPISSQTTIIAPSVSSTPLSYDPASEILINLDTKLVDNNMAIKSFKRVEEKILHRENKYLHKLASYDLLVIDEWLIFSLSEDDIRFLYELFELRYGKSSTIFVGQYPTTEWHTRLGGGAHADSILDRIVHNIIIIESGSINMRELLDSTKYKHQI